MGAKALNEDSDWVRTSLHTPRQGAQVFTLNFIEEKTRVDEALSLMKGEWLISMRGARLRTVPNDSSVRQASDGRSLGQEARESTGRGPTQVIGDGLSRMRGSAGPNGLTPLNQFSFMTKNDVGVRLTRLRVGPRINPGEFLATA